MRVLGMSLIVVVCAAMAICGGIGIADGMDAKAKETSSLEEVLERKPGGVTRYFDKENSVACYMTPLQPAISCVYIPAAGLTWRNKPIIK